MLLIGFTVLINVIIEMTIAFECNYNSSKLKCQSCKFTWLFTKKISFVDGILSRKALLWKVENENDIEISDATIKTESSNVDGTTTRLAENISKIVFTGK